MSSARSPGADALRLAMAGAEISCRDLARRIDRSERSVYQLLSGERLPSLHVAVELFRMYGIACKEWMI